MISSISIDNARKKSKETILQAKLKCLNLQIKGKRISLLEGEIKSRIYLLIIIKYQGVILKQKELILKEERIQFHLLQGQLVFSALLRTLNFQRVSNKRLKSSLNRTLSKKWKKLNRFKRN